MASVPIILRTSRNVFGWIFKLSVNQLWLMRSLAWSINKLILKLSSHCIEVAIRWQRSCIWALITYSCVNWSSCTYIANSQNTVQIATHCLHNRNIITKQFSMSRKAVLIGTAEYIKVNCSKYVLIGTFE